jgi:peptidoglycan hydrolase-like protein with peptidoglycan-binding domain
MWNGKICSVLAFSAAAIVISQPAFGARSRDYTEAEFISFLNGFGYPVALNDSLSEPRVQQAIRDFQVQYRLPLDGTINIPTQNKAAELVRNLQLNLNRLVKPNPPLPGTQIYGQLTDAAVRAFQKQQGLLETGIATLETRQRIANLVGTTRPDDSTPKPTQPQGILYTEAQFKSALIGLGYDINTQQPVSDPPTVRAIREIQELYGLSISGQADQRTQETVARVIRNLRNGLRITLKTNLLISQFYDADLAAALRKFQGRYALAPTGRANLAVRNLVDTEAKRSR